MAERTYPYTAWVLQPSFKPKEVVFVKSYGGWSGYDYGDCIESGKTFPPSCIHATKADAVTYGRKELSRQEVDLQKRQATIDKRKAALDKASE